MKQRLLIILIAVFALSAGQAHAQRYLPKMQGIEFRGGVVDGFTNSSNHYAGIAISTYTKSKDRWVLGAEYMQKMYDYKEVQIPKVQFTAEGGYYYMFLSNYSKSLFFSIGGSALLGYEVSNWGSKLLYDGATLRNKDSFIYGGAITFEIETYLSDKVVLLFNARERIMFGSSIGNFQTQIGMGVKFIIN